MLTILVVFGVPEMIQLHFIFPNDKTLFEVPNINYCTDSGPQRFTSKVLGVYRAFHKVH